MPSLSEIYEIVKEIPATLGKLPRTIVDAMKKAAGGIVGVTEPLVKNVGFLKQPFECSAQLIGYIATEGATVRGEGERLRSQLKTYFNGVENCIIQTNNLTKAVGGDLPQIGENTPFANELLDNVMGRIPDVVLLPVSKALNSRSGWESQPDVNSQLIEELTRKVLSKDLKDQFDVDMFFLKVLTLMKMTDGVLKLIIKLLPRDLNAGLAVVGEGGNLTLTGHPLAWVFVMGSFVLEEVQTVLSACQQAIKMQRSALPAPSK